MTDVAWCPAHELVRAYRDGDLSPVHVVERLLERIRALDGLYNVFVHIDAEGALRQARAAEEALREGRPLGPLHGVPCGVKDIIDVKGLPTTCHSAFLVGNIASRDAECVARLKEAGAIVLGKVATHEFALGGPSFDLPFPPARNPWNRECHPGGSSSGSGAGLAAGFFPLALGTDTGGSVRNPAGVCGAVGLKPTYERVSRDGVYPLSWTLDNVGPMARCARDAALLFDALTGEGVSERLAGSVRGLRIGFVRAYHERDMTAGPETRAALEAAARAFSDAGAVVRDVELPPLDDFIAISRAILTSEAWTIHGPRLRRSPERYAALTRRRLMVGAFVTAESYLRAKTIGDRLRQAVDEVFEGTDILLMANAMNPACRIDDAEAVARNYLQHARAPFNVTGHPALSLMCGLSGDGMPLAMQLVGPHGREDVLFEAARAYETLTDWTERRAPIPETAAAATV